MFVVGDLTSKRIRLNDGRVILLTARATGKDPLLRATGKQPFREIKNPLEKESVMRAQLARHTEDRTAGKSLFASGLIGRPRAAPFSFGGTCNLLCLEAPLRERT